MDTQARVLAMLNKVQTVRKVNKQNLGAIEDAIKDVKDKAYKITVELKDIEAELEEKLISAVDNILSEADNMANDVKDYSSLFDQKFDEYNDIVRELDDLGIDYPTDVLNDLEEKMEVTKQASLRVSSMDERTFYS